MKHLPEEKVGILERAAKACHGVEFKMSRHSCWGVFASTNSNLFSNHTFSESKLCSPKEICLA